MTITQEYVLKTQIRTSLGKKNRALRRKGLVPLHVYGLGKETLLLQAETPSLFTIIKQVGRTLPLRLDVEDGTDETVLVRDVSVHPVDESIIHVDLIRVSENIPVEIEIPLKLTGIDVAPITRGSAANITQSLYRIKVRALPFVVPQELSYDCSQIESIKEKVVAADIALPSDVVMVTSPQTPVLFVQISRASRSAESVAGNAEEATESESQE